MNLQNLNVTELSAQEVQETEGGAIGVAAACVIYGCCLLAGVAVGYWALSSRNE